MPVIARPLLVIAILMTLAALFSPPYAYYEVLRFVLCGLFTYSVVSSWERASYTLLFLMGAVAIIYNPLVPFHLNREIWVVVNLITAGLLGYLLAIKRT